MSDSPRALLLDTCAVIWLATGQLSQSVAASLVYAALADGVFVSPVSAWEIGMLSNPKGNRPKVEFLPDPIGWYAQLLSRPGIKEAPFSYAAAINASHLPEPIHGDPGDRLIIATAREMNVPVVTRDSQILAYAAVGHVQALPC
jgi:PIN domain nuclease of toxin-antitoxin system